MKAYGINRNYNETDYNLHKNSPAKNFRKTAKIYHRIARRTAKINIRNIQ
jgi:hypothetical protein